MKDGLKKGNFLNYSILVPYLLLSAIGIIMVFSTTVPYQLIHGYPPYTQVINQTAFMLLSFVAIAVIFRLKLGALKSKKILGFVMVVLILAMLAARFVFRPLNGAHGWIIIPGFGTIQPVEIAKIFVVWYLSSVFSEKQEEIQNYDIREVFKGKSITQRLIGGWRLPILSLIVIELIMPDLGNTIILTGLVLIMVGASGISWRWFSGYGKIFLVFILGIIGVLFATGGNLIPGSYVNARFRAYVNPFTDLAKSGHQLANSYYAVVNGGWLGRGLGNSIQKNGFLPEATTDFVFPIIVEELGIIGGILVLGVLFFLIGRMLTVGIRAKNPFNSLIAIGIASLLLLQVLVNVGGAIGVIPETGVTFPFVSQGGSSFFVLSLGVAFVLNISADEKRREISELSNQYFTQADQNDSI
ncbi:FtsW/RodA/SpoVE family cell cycle protein [Lactococcus hircilactis]|uniref:Probable peptidoglycan glycosyltransferase FtsW n=1 Tax=Lactococcus hircilactis TaxID=1494462 RepID=A0A7X1Z7A8_9LACT|nr:FtsW/RodA/SpoVE family cell cycle protein [Lactococcus hircilactis]MQW38988.1 FtsW/RodA/SpoVE family cell cycle protein [Lactococcus hircilactis]